MKFINKIFVVLLLVVLSACSENEKPNSFSVVMISKSQSNNWNAIKYNKFTGESWLAKAGSWKKIIDSKSIDDSVYKIEMVAIAKNWGAIRIDVNNGRSWRVLKGEWKSMGEIVPDS